MEYFRQQIKVGALLFATLVLLVLAALSVGNLGSWLAPKRQYTVLFRNSSLLPAGAIVSYAGLPVGQVVGFRMRSVEERQQQHAEYAVAVDVQVRASVPVRDDSRVEMKTDGMIGDRYVDILPGMGAPLAPDGTLVGSAGGLDGLFEAFAGTGGDVAGLFTAEQQLLADDSQPNSLPSILASLQHLLTVLPSYLPSLMTTVETLAQQTQQDITSISQSAKALLAQLDETVAENRAGLKHLIRDLSITLDDTRQALNTAQSLLSESQTRLPQTLDHLQALLRGIQENREDLAARLDELLAHMDSVVVQNDRNVFETIENLRQMTDHLEATAKLVRANPAVVLWGKRGKASTQREQCSPIETLQDRGRIGRYDRVR
jgi:phospholipid/cholesterol/gamma-HCH transport system substrate-binding protein